MRFDELNLKEYELIECLGGNDLFQTFLARQVNLGRYVTIRLLPTNVEQASQRFRNEVGAISILSHPNNCHVIDAGAATIERLYGPYLVLGYVLGDTLEAVLSQAEKLDPIFVLRIARQILGALAEAHQCGVLHRQLAPRSVLLTEHDGVSEHATLVDYGIEQALHPDTWNELALTNDQYGEFAAPEIFLGAPPTVQSDLYSAAAVLYKALVGSLFGIEEETTEVDSKAPSFDKLSVIRYDLLACLDRALVSEPEDRYTSAEEFLVALDPVVDKARVYCGSSGESDSQTSIPHADAGDPLSSLTDRPSIWVLREDPALDDAFIERIRSTMAHYSVEVLSNDDAKGVAVELTDHKLQQPWVILFGDLHVILQNRLLAAVSNLPCTQRILVSAKLNGAMLEASVNFCGVDKHLVLPIDVVSLSEALEERVAACRRQLLRRRTVANPQELRSSVCRITGEFSTNSHR